MYSPYVVQSGDLTVARVIATERGAEALRQESGLTLTREDEYDPR